MRPPERIDRILEKVREYWMEHQDLRLCQLMYIAASKVDWKDNDLFALEDDRLEEGLDILEKEDEIDAKDKLNRIQERIRAMLDGDNSEQEPK